MRSQSAANFASALADLVAYYYTRPVDFARDLLGIDLDPPFADAANAIARGERRIAIRSGHGVGKSTFVAVICIWWMFTRYPFKGVVTAPTASQLWDALWAEIRSRIRTLNPALQELFELFAERIVLRADPDNSFLTARTASRDRPEALQGIHSEHVLLVADEASGVPDEIFEAGIGSMSGENACTILCGNPTRRTGFFARVFLDSELSKLWYRVQVNGEHSPRVSRDFIEQVRRTYGEDSDEYRIRVRGDFPLSDALTLIPRDKAEAATFREIARPAHIRPVWGIDPARYGPDNTALAERRRFWVDPVQTRRGLSTMEIAGWIASEFNNRELRDQPTEILIDVIGLGAGVADRLMELDLRDKSNRKVEIRAINVSASAPIVVRGKPHGVRLRDQLWIDLAEAISAGTLVLPKDPELIDEICAPTYRFHSSGRMKVADKDDIRDGPLGRSPDRADAVCLTFASEFSALLGGKGAPGGEGPLRRNIQRY